MVSKSLSLSLSMAIRSPCLSCLFWVSNSRSNPSYDHQPTKSMAHPSARALVHDWRSLLGKIGKISSWDLWVDPVLTQQKLLHDRKETLLLQMFMDTLTSVDFLVPKVPKSPVLESMLCWTQSFQALSSAAPIQQLGKASPRNWRIIQPSNWLPA